MLQLTVVRAILVGKRSLQLTVGATLVAARI
jgi:hypothetical protein